jgi:hypothetical protein
MDLSPPQADPQARLVHELKRTLAVNEERAGNPILAGALDRLRAWQAARLRQTYVDLVKIPRYGPAIRFFEQDLYGARDFSRRDADLARIVPMMVRMAPSGVVHCVALAVELNALSQELDLALVKQLPRVDGGFTVADYCRAYRRAGDFTGRRRQIALIGEVGATLDRYVHKRLVRTSLAMMRRPAHVAGLAALQDFLERGFAAFRTMDGADQFLALVCERETRVHEAIVGGRNDPFADPTVLLASPEKARSP